MDPITLDPRAEDNGLAVLLRGLLVENLTAEATRRADFAAIATRFAVVAPDANVKTTLWFEGGRLTIYDGLRAGAEVVITASTERIPALSLLSIRYGLPWVLDDAGKGFVRALVRREIKIEGLVDLPFPRPRETLRRTLDLLRLTRVLAS